AAPADRLGLHPLRRGGRQPRAALVLHRGLRAPAGGLVHLGGHQGHPAQRAGDGGVRGLPGGAGARGARERHRHRPPAEHQRVRRRRAGPGAQRGRGAAPGGGLAGGAGVPGRGGGRLRGQHRGLRPGRARGGGPRGPRRRRAARPRAARPGGPARPGPVDRPRRGLLAAPGAPAAL
ncbi:MAG: Nitrilotriacetate monooxygenase component B, partial [uncultured Quadrisphaera sp.]